VNADKIWEPADAVRERAQITHYMKWLQRERGLAFEDYEALWKWSVAELEAFWASIWDYFDVRASAPYERVLVERRMPGAVWFPGARLNYADQVFRHATDSRPAIVFRSEGGDRVDLGWMEIKGQVASLAASLRRAGVGRGDRVVAYMPNIPETVIAFLAVASLGAVWSACSPDMGPVAVLDRFAQIAPKAMIAVDGYRYGGKPYDRREVVAHLLRQLPSVETLIKVGYLDRAPDKEFLVGSKTLRTLDWTEASSADSALLPEPVPFDHPLWIVYSSGTTGLPKPIVQGHGGILLEHLKMTGLHNDIGAGDRFHWFSSTAWVMWNIQVSGLLVGATICLYDGNPAWPDLGTLWRFVGENGATFFGAGAAFFAGCMKAEIHPAKITDLGRLRAIGSTGSPLPPDAYRWIHEQAGAELWLTSISGGTDVSSAFVGGVPILPVYAGEIQCRCLGVKVEAFDESGAALCDAVGELVCTEPMPSMPLYFWNDEGGARYHDSYFDMYPGVWRHGDWIRFTSRGGAVIYGRSDATINRHGIRMGTSELYRAVENLPEVMDSLVVDLEYLGRESYMPLFVVLRPGCELTEKLKARIVARIREALSSRHVPDEIFQIDEIPRTLSGKKLELPVRRLLLGHPVEKVVNRDSMSNPQSLAYFVRFAASMGKAPPQT
jgi:acetoacetyl-CoA synthetase